MFSLPHLGTWLSRIQSCRRAPRANHLARWRLPADRTSDAAIGCSVRPGNVAGPQRLSINDMDRHCYASPYLRHRIHVMGDAARESGLRQLMYLDNTPE